MADEPASPETAPPGQLPDNHARRKMYHQQRCRKNPANAELVREHAGLTVDQLAEFMNSEHDTPTEHDVKVDRVMRKDKQYQKRYRELILGEVVEAHTTRPSAEWLEDGEVAEVAENSPRKRRRHHRKGDLKVHFPVWIEEEEDTGRDRRPLHFIVELGVPMPANLYLPAPVRAGDPVGVRVQSLADSDVCTLVPSCRVRGIGTYFAAEVNAHLCKDDVPPADVCHRCRALVSGVHRAARRMHPPQAFDNLWLAYARTTRVPPPPRWRAALLSE